MAEILKSLGYFILAGLCEIGGGYLIWLWLKEGKPIVYALAGAIILTIYGITPGEFRKNLRRLWWHLHRLVHPLGLGYRQRHPGPFRHHRWLHFPHRRRRHHVLAPLKDVVYDSLAALSFDSVSTSSLFFSSALTSAVLTASLNSRRLFPRAIYFCLHFSKGSIK